jgi:hypothetical protein
VALAVLLAAAVPEALTIALNQVLQLRERMWDALLYVNIPRDAMLAILPWLVVPRLGLLGLVGTYLVARLIALGAIWLLTRRGSAELTAGA